MNQRSFSILHYRRIPTLLPTQPFYIYTTDWWHKIMVNLQIIWIPPKPPLPFSFDYSSFIWQNDHYMAGWCLFVPEINYEFAELKLQNQLRFMNFTYHAVKLREWFRVQKHTICWTDWNTKSWRIDYEAPENNLWNLCSLNVLRLRSWQEELFFSGCLDFPFFLRNKRSSVSNTYDTYQNSSFFLIQTEDSKEENKDTHEKMCYLPSMRRKLSCTPDH